MVSCRAILCALAFCHLVCFVRAVIGNTQSHWCSAIEMRRVTCLRNVSINGQPPTLRRVYQWKKELVMRCCPGFMGPTCEKACFSCQQWAEVTGRIHHLEQYLTRNPVSGSAGYFQPFRPDLSSRQVCWTKDGRPVHGEITPRKGEGGRGHGGGKSETSEKENERSRLGYYADTTYQHGCPIYSNRRSGVGGAGEGRNSPYSTQKQQRQQRDRHEHHHQQQQQQVQQQQQHEGQPHMAISVDASRVSSDERQDFKSSHKIPASVYQRHPSVSANQKHSEEMSQFKAAEMVVSLDQPLPSTSSPPLSSKTRTKKEELHDNALTNEEGRDKSVDVPQRIDKEQELALQNRVSTLEKQILELETKLSGLSPALTSVSSLKDEIGQLTNRIAKLQVYLEIPENIRRPRFNRRHDGLSSGRNENTDRVKATERKRKRKRYNRRRSKHRTRGETLKDLNRKPSSAESDHARVKTPALEDVNRHRQHFTQHGQQRGIRRGDKEKHERLENHQNNENGEHPLEGNEMENSQSENKSKASANENNRMREIEKPFSVTEELGEDRFQFNSSQTQPNSQNFTQENRSSAHCNPFCGGSSLVPPPPLPDKDVVEAVFSTSASVVDALGKGHQEFYEQLKKVLNEQQRKDATVGHDLMDEEGNKIRAPSLIRNGERKRTKHISIPTGLKTKGIRLPLEDNHNNKHYNRADFLVSSNNLAPSPWAFCNALYILLCTLAYVTCTFNLEVIMLLIYTS